MKGPCPMHRSAGTRHQRLRSSARLVITVACLAGLLNACSNEETSGGTTTTVAPTTAAPSTTTTAQPDGSSLGDVPPFSETAASGSGCDPGADSLPDGWWYGYAKTPIGAGSSFDFDLACFYIGRIAAQVAHDEDPVTFPDPSFIENDYYVSNSNERTRPVSVPATAELLCIDLESGLQQACSSPGVAFGVWVRVEDGVTTKVLEQFVP